MPHLLANVSRTISVSLAGVGCGFVVAYLRMMGLCAIVIAGIAYYAVCCSCPDLSFQINIPAAIAVILVPA